jgi:hypothetical protein
VPPIKKYTDGKIQTIELDVLLVREKKLKSEQKRTEKTEKLSKNIQKGNALKNVENFNCK